jgi:hypothetical protein
MDLAAAGAGRTSSPATRPLPDVHQDRGHGHLGLAAAEPVREALRLGPLLPHVLAGRVEDAVMVIPGSAAAPEAGGSAIPGPLLGRLQAHLQAVEAPSQNRR